MNHWLGFLLAVNERAGVARWRILAGRIPADRGVGIRAMIIPAAARPRGSRSKLAMQG